MQEPEPKIVGRRADLTNDQSAGNPTKPSATSAPPEAAKTWLTLPPVAFNESESPWRKINDQTVRLSDDNIPPASPVPSEIFLG
jgi:hypothetical protein